MRKAISILIISLLATVVSAKKLDPEGNNVCGAGSMTSDPAVISGEAQFDLIYDNLNALIGTGELPDICADEGTVWDSDDLGDHDYSYMMVKFEKPGDYPSSGTLHWQVWTDQDDAEVYLYRWNKTGSPHAWSALDSNQGYQNPNPPDTETITIPSSYFDANGELWLLYKSYAPSPAQHLFCDVSEIIYTP